MEWIKPLIILIGAAVWIISHLLSKDPAKQATPPRPLPPPVNDPTQPRTANSDLETFLEEMRQRKKQDEDDIPDAIVLDEPRETPRPAPPPPIVRREERRRSRPIGSRVPRRPEPVIVVQPLPLPEPEPPPARPATPTITITPAVLPPLPPPSGPRSTAPMPAPQSQETPQKRILNMLKDRKSLAAVFLLREVLGPPLCKRRHAV